MIIGGKRNCGKTTELIKIASEEQLYIICADMKRVRYIVDLATNMNLSIPFPICVRELPLRSPYINKVLVDDIEDVLSRVIGKEIFIASSSEDFKEMN